MVRGVCVVEGCPVGRAYQRDEKYKRISLFRFPVTDVERLRKFLDFVNLEELRNPSERYVNLDKLYGKYTICELHFEDRFLSKSTNRSRLTVTAIPTLNPPPNGIIPDPPVPYYAKHQQQPSFSSESFPACRNNSQVESTVLGNVEGLDSNCAAEYRSGTIEHDEMISSQMEKWSHSLSGISHACDNKNDVSVERQYRVLADAQHIDVREGLCPRSYEIRRTEICPKEIKNFVKYGHDCTDNIDDNVKVEVDTTSSQLLGVSSHYEDDNRAIDLPISAVADHQSLSVNGDDYSLQEVLSPASDLHSTDSVVLIDESVDECKDPLSSTPTTTSLQEVESTSEHLKKSPLMTGGGACKVESMEHTTATLATSDAQQLGDMTSHFSENIEPELSNFSVPSVKVPVANLMYHSSAGSTSICVETHGQAIPYSKVTSEAYNTDPTFCVPCIPSTLSYGVQSGSKPKCDLSHKPKLKSKRQMSRVFLTPRNTHLYHGLNASKQKCKKLNRKLEQYRETIKILRKKCSIKRKDEA